MANYLTSDTELTSIANAIRAKGGTSAPLVYPNGFISAVQAIETGVDTSDATATASDILPGKTAYVNGSKITGSISTKAAQTYTPGTASQTIAANQYLTGAQTIAGDANLVADNIAEGVSIFGVTGTHSGGGGDVEDGIIMRTISGAYENSRVTTIGSCAFLRCSALVSVSFSACTSIGSSAFQSCSRLITVSFPACTSIGGHAFYSCASLTTASFPACTSIGSNAFYNCSRLTTASFSACTNIGNSVFYRCYNLISLYLTGSSYVTLSNSNAFSSTPIAGYTTSTGGVYGSIYVPSSMLASYQTRTNWTYFSNRMVGI